MEAINTKFLTPSFASSLNDIDTNEQFIKGILLQFQKKQACEDTFIQVNIAVFKFLKMYIFHKVNYDYMKLQKIERFFYRFLYVADKYTTDTSVKELKKLFKESNNFARKTSNPLTVKGEEKLNSFLQLFEKAIIEPGRLERRKYADELKELDEKVNETQKMLSDTQQQEEKLKKAIKHLLEEHSGEPKTIDHIVKMIRSGTDLKPVSQKVGGRRRRMRGGEPPVDCIIDYLTGIVTITQYNITPMPHGRYKITGIDKFNESLKVLPEVAKLIKEYNTKVESLDKIIYADKVINAFKLATKTIEIASDLQKALYDASSIVDDALKAINKKPEAAAPAAPAARVGGGNTTAQKIENAKKFIDTNENNFDKGVNTFITTTLTQYLENKEFVFNIIKSKYESHPLVILNNKLESLV